MSKRPLFKNKQSLGLFYAIFSAATFGLIPLFSLPIIHGGISTETTLVYRFGVATPVTESPTASTMRQLNFSPKRPIMISMTMTGYKYCKVATIELGRWVKALKNNRTASIYRVLTPASFNKSSLNFKFTGTA